MKLRSTLILVAVAGGLFAYITLYDSKRPSTKEAALNARRVVDLDRDQIKAISIKNAEAEIELRKQDNDVWMLEKPLKDRADAMAINGLFTSIEGLQFAAVLGEDKPLEKDQLKEFGLSNAETKITFSGGEKPVELLFGKDAAVEGRIYVKLADGPKVFVIPNQFKNQISKKADEFRDHRLSELTMAQVNKVAIKTAAGEIELEKKNDHWSIVKPLKARGDDARIGDLIAQTTTARIDSFLADSTNLTAYGLQEPRGTVSLFSEGHEKPTVLQIGANLKNEKAPEQVYAKLSSRDAVVLLPKTIEGLLETKPNDLRDKNLLRVEADIVDRIHIEGAGQEKIVLVRQGESWVRKAGQELPINATLATRLLSELGSQQVANFAADVATDLPKYGLDQPAVKVTLSSYASENTAETKAGEKPIATLLFGKVEGENVYAKLDDEPFIVAVPRYILESLPTDPLQWQKLTLHKFKPEEITSLDVARNGQPTTSLERDKDKWKLAKGDGNLNQISVQSLVNTLSTLRAVRWVGASTPQHGFDQPTAVVLFKTAGGAAGKLVIGAKAPDETYFASLDGFIGTFALSRPDQEAFVTALLDKPATEAAPTAPAQPAPTAVPTPAPTEPAAPSPAKP